MSTFSDETKQYFQLLIAMTVKDVTIRYKRALFGFLWIVLNPLLQMIIIASIFSFIIKVPINNYPLFLFVGLLLWNFFSLSLTKTTPSIVNERSLIQKAKFQRTIIPASIVLSNFFHLIISIALLTIWVILFGKIQPPHLLLVIPILFWLLIFTLGFSLLTSTINVRYRDISFFLQVGLQLLFYATPIIYPLSFIPAKLHIIFFLNPLTSIIQVIQYIFANHNPPALNLLLVNILISTVIALTGIIVFRKQSPFFDDWI